ncbi:MAG: F0F1 ATP synthase subunit B [Candidatus Eremiobacteraeota bacterium]|nr:F0F1 ATP synthase subunit B [Candidatus Eremiobacteraeota bacterium]
MELSIPTIVIQIVNFLIFLAVITHFLYRPVIKMLNARKTQIEKEIKDAEALKAQAAGLRQDYEAKLRDAQKTAQDIIRKATESGESIKNDIVNEAKKEAQHEKERGEEEIKLERERALQSISTYVADLAVTMAGKVLASSLDKATHQRLMEDFVKKVETGDVK